MGKCWSKCSESLGFTTINYPELNEQQYERDRKDPNKQHLFREGNWVVYHKGKFYASEPFLLDAIRGLNSEEQLECFWTQQQVEMGKLGIGEMTEIGV